MCVDNFSLPHIDTLVDNTAKHSLFSFMDGFSGYNQIRMTPKDMEKTIFLTMRNFLLQGHAFWAKKGRGNIPKSNGNVVPWHDAQRDRGVCGRHDSKVLGWRCHVVNLKKLFKRLKKFQLKLNPTKCTFGATFGRLLRFMVSKKGIEIDLDKVRAIQDLPPLQTQKKVRSFMGKLNYIARFIFQMTAKCDPIFKML